MEMSATLQFEWKDEFLTWRPDMNSGIKEISLPADKVWKPDFVTYNSVCRDPIIGFQLSCPRVYFQSLLDNGSFYSREDHGHVQCQYSGPT